MNVFNEILSRSVSPDGEEAIKLTKSEQRVVEQAKACQKAGIAPADFLNAKKLKKLGKALKKMGKAMAPMVDHPRPGQPSASQSDRGPSLKKQGAASMVDHPRPGAAQKSADFVDHPRPGQGGDDDWHESNLASKGDGAMDMGDYSMKSAETQKAINEPDLGGEPLAGQAGSIGAERLSASTSHDSEDGHYGEGQQMNGMPPADSAYDTPEEFSSNDRSIDNEMQWEDPDLLASSRKYGQGNASFDGMGWRSDVDTLPLPGSSPEIAKSDDGERKRAQQVSNLRKSRDIEYTSGVATPRAQPATQQLATTWQQGFVTYSDGEDRRISKALDSDGHVFGEPSVDFSSPLVKSKGCTMCKSRFPSFLTTCPDCGQVEHGSPGRGHGRVILEKSVMSALRPNKAEDMYFPGGDVTIHFED